MGYLSYVDIWLVTDEYLVTALKIDTSFGDYRTKEQRVKEQQAQERKLMTMKTVKRVVICLIVILDFLFSICYFKCDLVIIELAGAHKKYLKATRVF